MAVYIELTTDAFEDRFSNTAGAANNTAGAGLTAVRRPLRGLEIKDDTYAYIKLIRADGAEVDLSNSSADGGTASYNSNFIIQSITEQRMERHQIVETFGDTYLFVFGESPRFLNVQAMLINSNDFNWEAEFMDNYDKYLRGTKAVEMGARTYLFYDQNVVEGYLLNCQISKTSTEPFLVPLSFQFFVTNSQNISLIGPGSENYPTRSSATIPLGIDLTDSPGGEALDALVNAGSGIDTFNNNPQPSNPTPFGIGGGVGIAVGVGVGVGVNAFTGSAVGAGVVTPVALFNRGVAATSPSSGDAFNRTSPIRSLILDNKDEYTTPLQPITTHVARTRRNKNFHLEVNVLELAVAGVMKAFGTKDADNPFLMDSLGFGPTFLPQGVGIGAFAGAAALSTVTFGATSNAQAGAFAGQGSGIGAQFSPGFASSGTAFQGVGVSSLSGASAGVGFGLNGIFNPPGNVQLSPTARSGQRVVGPNGVPAGAGAFASINPLLPQNSSYSYANTLAAAQAGGYYGANNGLSFSGPRLPLGSSYGGAPGSAGASIGVGGTVSAFSLVSSPGTIQNVNVPLTSASFSESF